MTSCLELFPSGTAVLVTFTMYGTRLMESALKTARRVPNCLEPAHYMVPDKDPGTMKWGVERKV